MKKFVSVLLCCCMLCPLLVFNSAAEGNMPVEVRAKAAILMDQTTGKVLAAMNENERLYPASVTKIMTLLLVMEGLDENQFKLTDTVTASANAASKGGSQIWLKEGETMTVDELLKAAAVYSANDACTALAEFIAGSEPGFITMMNLKAKELGMENTVFENCTGLDDDTVNHLTTAYDIALMSRELMKYELITQYTTIWMDSLRDGKTELVNTNKLVRFYNGATGLKTGTTSKAGCCISATATRDGTSLIAVILGSDNSQDRFEGAKALLNWGFANYSTVMPQVNPNLITPVKVVLGEESVLMPQTAGIESVLVPKGREGDITQEISLATEVQAPVESNQTLGTVTLKLDGKKIGEYQLTAPHYVDKLSFATVFRRMLLQLCK